MLELPRWVLEVVFILYVVVVSGFVVLERRRPTATLALVLTLAFLPVIGLIVYWLFSRRRVQRRRRKRQRRAINPVDGTRNIANLERLPDGMPPSQRGLVRLALETAAAPLRRAEAVELLPSAREALAAVTRAIETAQRCIHLEFYIWRDDDSGRRITQMLTTRAKEGIKVRVLYDHLGSWGLPTEHFSRLREAGGEVAVFGRLRVPYRFARSRVNFRNHRKLLTVDGRIGFVGGLNVGDEYFGEVAGSKWRDLFVQLDGDAVIGLEAIFLEDWLASTGHVIDLEGERASLDVAKAADQHNNPFAPLPDLPMVSDGPLVQVIPSGPDIPVASAIAAQFSATIASAHSRSWIATPYLIPDEPLSLILRTAAMRGVDVRILVPDPAQNDQKLIAIAARSYYDELLEVGCRIYEYEPGMLHSKYLIADEVAAIGSANMDVRSFHINYEVTAMFYDGRVTAALAAVFLADLERAREVRATDRIELPLWTRFLESGARVLSPLL